MIIINKKRILFIIMFILISTFTYSINTKKEKIISTSSLPVSNKVVILDAGHGKPDEGASSNLGTTEESINLKITKKVQNLLEQSGSTVILTRSDENGIYDQDENSLRNKKVSDIKIIAGEKAINTTVSQRNNEITLPNAGNSTWLVVIIVILILLMILFKFKSRKIKY